MANILLLTVGTVAPQALMLNLVKQGHKVKLHYMHDVDDKGGAFYDYELVILSAVGFRRELIELISILMAQAPNVPMLLVADGIKDRDLARLLDVGVEDCITHSCGDVVLAARIRVLLRRRPVPEMQGLGLQVGQYRTDFESRSIYLREHKVRLTDREFNIAKILFRNLNNTVPRVAIDCIIQNAAADPVSRSLDTHIFRLRQKLDFSEQNGLLLSCVYGKGYVLHVVLGAHRVARSEDSIVCKQSMKNTLALKV